MEFSARVVEKISGYPLSMRFALNCDITVLNAVSEEMVRRSLNGSSSFACFAFPIPEGNFKHRYFFLAIKQILLIANIPWHVPANAPQLACPLWMD